MKYKTLLQVRKIKALAAFYVLLFLVLIFVTIFNNQIAKNTAKRINFIQTQALNKLNIIFDIRNAVDNLQLLNLKYVIEISDKEKNADEHHILILKDSISHLLNNYKPLIISEEEKIYYSNIIKAIDQQTAIDQEFIKLDKADLSDKEPLKYYNTTQKISHENLQKKISDLYLYNKKNTEILVTALRYYTNNSSVNLIATSILMYLIILIIGILIANTLNNLLVHNKLLKDQDLLLKKEKQFSESLVIDSPNALVGVNEKGIITIFNKQAEVLFGYQKEEIIGQSVMKLIPPEEHNDQKERMDKHFHILDFRDENKEQSNKFGLRKDGTIFNADLFISTIENTDGITALSSIIDLTEKVESDKKINQLAGILDNSNAFVAIAGMDDKIIYLNPAMKNALGILPEENVEQYYIKDFAPESENDKKIKTILPEVSKTGKWFGESKLISRNGTIIPIIQVIILNYNSKGEPFSISTTAIDITKIKENEESLKKLTKDLRALYVKQMKLKEEERKVIAKEIHDVMGQNLTGIKMDTAWILKNIDSGNIEEIKERAEQLKKLTEDTVQSSRQLYTHLYPQMLEEVGLVGAIRWNNKTLLRNFKMAVKFNTELEEEELFPNNPFICLALYRIYQECLTNIIRYAEAENVSIDLFIEDGEIELSVKDDGIGFEIDKVDTINHHGLIGIRERVYAFNGKLVINSQLGKGTITTVSIPIPKEED